MYRICEPIRQVINLSSIVGLAVESILFGAIGVVGINLVLDTTMANASATVTTIVQTVVPLIIGVAAILIFLKRAGYSVKM